MKRGNTVILDIVEKHVPETKISGDEKIEDGKNDEDISEPLYWNEHLDKQKDIPVIE